MMKPRLKVVCLTLAVVFLSSTSAFAQKAPNYGTAGLTSYPIGPLEFIPYTQDTTYQYVLATPYRYLTGGPVDRTQFEAGVHLPQGASVEMFEVSGCDNSAAGTFGAQLATAADPTGEGFPIVGIETEMPDMPGCVTLQKAVTPPVTIDNEHNLYWVGAVNSSYDGTTYVTAVRVYYRLQVSPAPAAPTFGDVPTTDPGFQYIEAFVAAGITAGCGGGNFCPDATVTRRQMAVFFSKALGLYWPN